MKQTYNFRPEFRNQFWIERLTRQGMARHLAELLAAGIAIKASSVSPEECIALLREHNDPQIARRTRTFTDCFLDYK